MTTRRQWLLGALAAAVAAASVPVISWPWECAWRNTREIRAFWIYRRGSPASRGPMLGIFLGPYPHGRTMWGLMAWRDVRRPRYPIAVGWWDGACRYQRAESLTAIGGS